MTLKNRSRREESKRKAALCGVTVGVLALGACQLQPDDFAGNSGADGGSRYLGAAGSAGAGGAAGSGSVVAIQLSTPPDPSAGGNSATSVSGAPPPYLDPASGLTPPPVAAAAGSACDSSDPSAAGGVDGVSSVFAANAGGGMAGAAVAGAAGATPPLFCDQSVWNAAPANRTLYSWTTAEQVAELRADQVLLSRTETPGLGRGYAFTAIDALAARGTAPENALLAKLSNELFTKVRYAWPNAWATRMGWPGEDYGDQLLRIVLKPEAWIVIVRDGQGIAVIDMNNQLVSIADAVENSERIGAIYFYKKDITGNGTFQVCSGGYREFIVGNAAMIEEWSLGTEDIRDRILADAALIDAFFADVRAAPPPVDPATFNQLAVCSWDNAASDEVGRYEDALSIPSEYYAPLPEQLATLSQTLRASVFDPDPLVVHPGD